jgi:hypothetical protein
MTIQEVSTRVYQKLDRADAWIERGSLDKAHDTLQRLVGYVDGVSEFLLPEHTVMLNNLRSAVYRGQRELETVVWRAKHEKK